MKGKGGIEGWRMGMMGVGRVRRKRRTNEVYSGGVRRRDGIGREGVEG